MRELGIQDSLESIDAELKDLQDRRERLIKGTRDVIMFCSRSIIALHRGDIYAAKRDMESAKSMLDELRAYAMGDLKRYVVVAEQELVEAYVLRSVIEGSTVPSMDDLQVSGPAYLTGLLDCIGEIKRLVYDNMRTGKGQGAESLFEIMEEIYGSVYPFAIYDNVVAGLRKKLDVARMLIEDIRAAVTEESRRKSLIDAVGRLEDNVKR